LKGFAPTDLANPELFGTGNDVTNPGSSIYYQTKNGMPWAINVPAQFEYTIEKSEILKGYPVFAKWILSSGNDYNDWYLDKQGYRNWDYIYRW
jgi:LruC domain-containing protein